jgi:hypothetical protein
MKKAIIAATALAFALAGCGGGGAGGAPSGQSDSYKAGYADGLNGQAHTKAAPQDMSGLRLDPANNRDACWESYQDAIANRVQPWDKDDYVEGCMQALQDHPPATTHVTVPTMPDFNDR